MRTCSRTLGIVLVGLGLGLASALAFDGAPNGRAERQSLPSPGAGAPLRGDANSINSLEYAAEKGEPAAQWRLGHMYAKGDGVPRSDVRAFAYFGKIANSHA